MTEFGGNDPNPFDVPMPVTGLDYAGGQVTAQQRKPLLIVLINKIADICHGIEKSLEDGKNLEQVEVATKSMKALIIVLTRTLRESELTVPEIMFAVRILYNECLCKSIQDLGSGEILLTYRNGFLKLGLVSVFQKVIDDLNGRLSPEQKINFNA